MTRYAGNAAALRALVRDQEVHRDVYVSEEVFQLEMEHMFPNSWVYVGHDSQVPNAGDYFGTTIGTQPIPQLVITGSLLTVLPISAAFLYLQRYWQSGLATGAVK